MSLSFQHGTWPLMIHAIQTERLVLPGLRVAELGCQTIEHGVFGATFTAKTIFELFGAHHISFDWNGRRGALKHDLGKPLPEKYRGQFDVVTNNGTAEHVETSQYWCWRNIHELSKVGGILTHSVPEVGSWRGHCRIRYTGQWFEAIANANGYETILHRRWPGESGRSLVQAIFKRTDHAFVDEDVFAKLPGIRDRSR